MTDPVETTKARLLEAALRVLRAQGVPGATSRQIAAAAGTNLQAITYHFGSKDELLGQALVGAVKAWVEPVRQSLRGLTDDPVGHLVRAVWQLQASLDHALPLVPAYLQALALAPQREQIREQISVLLRGLRDDLGSSIAELRDHGLVADWVQPQAMAALVVAAADGVAIHMSVDPQAIPLDEVLDQVVQLLLAASTMPGSG